MGPASRQRPCGAPRRWCAGGGGSSCAAAAPRAARSTPQPPARGGRGGRAPADRRSGTAASGQHRLPPAARPACSTPAPSLLQRRAALPPRCPRPAPPQHTLVSAANPHRPPPQPVGKDGHMDTDKDGFLVPKGEGSGGDGSGSGDGDGDGTGDGTGDGEGAGGIPYTFEVGWGRLAARLTAWCAACAGAQGVRARSLPAARACSAAGTQRNGVRRFRPVLPERRGVPGCGAAGTALQTAEGGAPGDAQPNPLATRLQQVRTSSPRTYLRACATCCRPAWRSHPLPPPALPHARSRALRSPPSTRPRCASGRAPGWCRRPSTATRCG